MPSRRDFVKTLAAAAVSLSAAPSLAAASRSVKIADLQVFPVLFPVVGDFRFLTGPKGFPPGRVSAIVKITADDGTTGWGESIPSPRWSYETLQTVTTTLRTFLAPELIGHEVFDLVGVHRIMNRHIAPSFSTGQPIAKSGVDIALHDLIGKLTNRSLPELWGREPEASITLSWTLSPQRLDDLDALIEEGWKRGYRHFNVKVSPDPAYDLEMCRRVKARVPDGFLWADANGGYDVATALEVAPKLADLGVDVLEQPLPSNRLSGYRDLRRQKALPIIMDEGVVSPVDLIEFIRFDLLDGVAMKLPRCGGLMPARRQIEILSDAGLVFLGSGLTDPDISLAATLALYGAFEYKLPAALNGPQFITQSVVKTPFVPVDGKLPVPRKPGLGIEVDEEKIQELLVEI